MSVIPDLVTSLPAAAVLSPSSSSPLFPSPRFLSCRCLLRVRVFPRSLESQSLPLARYHFICRLIKFGRLIVARVCEGVSPLVSPLGDTPVKCERSSEFDSLDLPTLVHSRRAQFNSIQFNSTRHHSGLFYSRQMVEGVGWEVGDGPPTAAEILDELIPTFPADCLFPPSLSRRSFRMEWNCCISSEFC